MKILKVIKRTGLFLGAVMLLTGGSAFAQFDVDWFTVDGGGASSSGGDYGVSGTIGQPDARSMTGGQYALVGGFWAVQFTPRPVLRMWVQGQEVVVAWPIAAGACQLQRADAFNATDWPAVTEPPVQVGDEWQVRLPRASFSKFMRLVEL